MYFTDDLEVWFHLYSKLPNFGSILYYTIITFEGPRKEAFLKILWEKEKMLVTSLFSSSNNVFYPIKKTRAPVSLQKPDFSITVRSFF